MAAAGAASAARASTLLLAMIVCVAAPPARAQADDANAANAAGAAGAGCKVGARFLRAFDSGSAWSGCAHLDPVHGLEITELAWRAPGDAARSVLGSLHPSSILVQDEGTAAPVERLDAVLRPLAETASTCGGEVLAVPADRGGTGAACARRTDTGLLSKYGDIRGVQGAAWWLESAREGAGGDVWQTRIGLGEEGTVTAELALSGRAAAERVVRAMWRVAFALDTPAPDTVDELDFALEPGPGSRRPMRVTRLGVETLRRVAPERFRVWRIADASGAGYLLDPLTSVAAPPRFGPNWTGFELAVTARDDAERHAARAPTLDGFVDGDPLGGADPVLWHAMTMTVRPDATERAALRPRTLSFSLLPFDWTTRSPFEGLAR